MSKAANRNALILGVPALGLLLLMGTPAPTRAGDNDCDRRIHQAEEKLRKAVDRYGEHSSQAERRRHELEETRKSCGDRH